MTQYNIDFAERIIETARFARGNGKYDFAAAQVVSYLTQLSIELSLKAFLEQAGEPVASIKKCSHSLNDLLTAVSRCEIRIELVPNFHKFVPATRIRSIPVQWEQTVGGLISKLEHDCSKYPNEIRYGTKFYGLPADTLIELAGAVNRFVKQHWESVRLR